ncbi:MAG: hypothetical protein ACREXP_09380 [Steroidobacteraceae bacterium]
MFLSKPYRFDDGSSIEVVDRETLRYVESGFETLIWVDAEPGMFKAGRIIMASSIERWTKAPDGAPDKIDAEQRSKIVQKALEYYRHYHAKVRVEE